MAVQASGSARAEWAAADELHITTEHVIYHCIESPQPAHSYCTAEQSRAVGNPTGQLPRCNTTTPFGSSCGSSDAS
jgi:hypothetical protein